MAEVVEPEVDLVALRRRRRRHAHDPRVEHEDVQPLLPGCRKRGRAPPDAPERCEIQVDKADFRARGRGGLDVAAAAAAALGPGPGFVAVVRLPRDPVDELPLRALVPREVRDVDAGGPPAAPVTRTTLPANEGMSRPGSKETPLDAVFRDPKMVTRASSWRLLIVNPSTTMTRRPTAKVESISQKYSTATGPEFGTELLVCEDQWYGKAICISDGWLCLLW